MTARMKRLCAGVALACAWIGADAAPPAEHPAATRAIALARANAAATHATEADAFAVRDIVSDADGAQHVRMDRSYKGLRVIGGDLVVHADARGGFRGASLTLRGPIRIDTTARYDESAAVQYAQALFAGTPEGTPKSALVVYARGPEPVLAYDVTVSGEGADGTPSVLHLIIDANALQLLDRYDEVQTNTAAGTADTLLSGAVGVTTDSQSSGFALRDPSRSNNYTTDLAGKRSGTGKLFTDADNTWGNFTTADGATVGGDAHYGMALTWDYYKTTFGRQGIDNAGSTTFSRVHYSRNYVNAFWSDACFCMTYGDGDGSTYLPLVAIDVAGHEMTHGVTARSANLTYSGESGGLNEGTSDIFGTMVEYFANNAKNPPNYLIGERIYVANNGVANPTRALRYMFKPSLDGRSPDCYSGSIGSLDVHYSSGVANHFFYLLAEGAAVPAGFNLTAGQLVCNGNTAAGRIGRDAASKVYYRALTVYMTSNTSYAGARQATLKAAADLYGSGSTAYNGVASAWSAVGVN